MEHLIFPLLTVLVLGTIALRAVISAERYGVYLEFRTRLRTLAFNIDRALIDSPSIRGTDAWLADVIRQNAVIYSEEPLRVSSLREIVERNKRDEMHRRQLRRALRDTHRPWLRAAYDELFQSVCGMAIENTKVDLSAKLGLKKPTIECVFGERETPRLSPGSTPSSPIDRDARASRRSAPGARRSNRRRTPESCESFSKTSGAPLVLQLQ